MTVIERNEYKRFVEQHIIWPYQDNAYYSSDDSNIKFSDWIWWDLPNKFSDHPEWREKVFLRIAECFDNIEYGFFPDDLTGASILALMVNHGVGQILIR